MSVESGGRQRHDQRRGGLAPEEGTGRIEWEEDEEISRMRKLNHRR